MTLNKRSNESSTNNHSMSMIDCGIRSLLSLPVKPSLHSINLHSNQISKIENLIYLQHLVHLDLSSNRIAKIQGLEGLVSLGSLNLSCNQIQSIEGLDGLKQLVYLNLSYNRINQVGGLGGLWGSDYRLECLLLQSNFISSLEEISYFLSGLCRLKHLTLSENKFVRTCSYRDKLFASMKQLASIDGTDRLKNKVSYHHYSAAQSSELILDDVKKVIAKNEPVQSKKHVPRRIRSEEDLSNIFARRDLDKVESELHALLRERDRLKNGGDCSIEESEDEFYESQIRRIHTDSRKPAKRPSNKGILKPSSDSKNSSYSGPSEPTRTAPINSEVQQPVGLVNQDLIKMLQGQLDGYKKTQDENIKQIGELKQTLDNNTKESDRVLREKQVELEREKELNKVLIKDLDDTKRLLEQSEAKIKHLETKSLKLVVHKEEKMKQVHKLEMANMKCKYESVCKESASKIEQLETRYKDLEDEFRSALLIESSRFNNLKEKYDGVIGEANDYKTKLVAVEEANSRNKSLINELNELIKDQKARIAELSKIRKETSEDVNKRNIKLNEAVADCVKLRKQCEELKREKSRVEAAFKKVVVEFEEIRAEKQLWSSKLVEQKTLLMQENNRIEMENKYLNQEVVSLRASLEKESDQCRIKSKVIEDQTQTIQKLKSALVEKDEALKKRGDEAISTQKSLEKQINHEMDVSNDLRVKLEKSLERKDELKAEIEQITLAYETLKLTHDKLVENWNERAHTISDIEAQIKKKQTSFEQKEKEFVESQQQLMKENADLLARLRKCDDNFRLQYDAEKREHMQKIEQIKQEYENKLAEAEERVKASEDEMRLVLKDCHDQIQAYKKKWDSASTLFAQIKSGFEG